MDRNLGENDKYLEYEENEIHSLLVALLDKEGIESYKSQFCSYQQVIVEKMEKFSHATNRNDKGEPELRAPNSIIFALREKLFVNIYPTTLPRIINNNFVFDFEEMFKEAIFELQNFLQENPFHLKHEIVFTVPVNKGNYQWVEVTIEIHQNGEAIAYVNDPMGGGTINYECYKEFREIMSKNLFGQKLAEGETKISSLSYKLMSHPKIQRDRYSGGAVRRMRDGIIINNDPYNWKRIDLKGKEITTDYKDSIAAREADLDLLLSSKHPEIKKTREKLLFQRYDHLTALLKNAEENMKEIITNIYNKYRKFIYINEKHFIDSNGTGIIDEDLLVEQILSNFETILKKPHNEDEKKKLKLDWLEFSWSMGDLEFCSPKRKAALVELIDKINEVFFDNQMQKIKILSSLHTKDQPSSESYHKSPKSQKCSAGQEFTGPFGDNTGFERIHFLLDNFIEDSNKCIYFPEERFINKMKSIDDQSNKVMTFIEETVKLLKKNS